MKVIKTQHELALKLPAICLPHQDEGIPLSAFSNGIKDHDLVLMSENLEDLRERFQRWRDALESKGLRILERLT